jgi:hypothetical protein
MQGWQAVTVLTVYVPAGEATWGIAPGSAIIGTDTGDTVRIDYEGGVYGQVGLDVFANRLLHAGARHVDGYPTTARLVVPAAALHAVGTYDAATNELMCTDEQALAAWVALWQPRR